jgi:glycosyltransferase involved in cell wall biosynthesis
MYNEAQGLRVFFARVTAAVKELPARVEIICVDDGSSDSTLADLMRSRDSLPELKILALSRNFGKDIALTAGLDHAVGDAVIPLDADLQDPPELIPRLFEKWLEGYEVVEARRMKRGGDSLSKRKTAGWFYRIFNRLSTRPIPENVGDFRLMDRKVVDAVRRMPETNRFMKGLFAWVGFRRATVDYDRGERSEGATKWNYWKLFNFAVDGIVAFSSLPLRVWSYIGFTVSGISFLYGSFLILRTLLLGRDVPGYASIMTVMLFLGGIQLISLGVMGEYIGRIHDEVKRRPLYLVREKHGI